MILYVMRHGIAIDRDDPGCPAEAKRFLTKEGVSKTREAAEALRALEVSPKLWFTSPCTRAVQTADITAEVLNHPADRIISTDALLPQSSPEEFYNLVSGEKAPSAICFGHAPHQDELIALLLGSEGCVTSLKKSGIACIEVDFSKKTSNVLQWLMGPRIFRLIKTG